MTESFKKDDELSKKTSKEKTKGKGIQSGHTSVLVLLIHLLVQLHRMTHKLLL